MIVIHMARKPLIGSVAKTVLQYGTGGINIGACRIGTETVGWGGGGRGNGTWTEETCGLKAGEARPVEGRWPANLVMEHSPGCVLVGKSQVTAEISSGEETSQFREEWKCTPGCPLTHLVAQGGSGDYFLQVQGEPEFLRAEGDTPCPDCGRAYRDHQIDGKFTFLNVLCNGTRVKL